MSIVDGTLEKSVSDEKRARIERAMRDGLPHRYSQKHYFWSKEIFEDMDSRTIMLCAANQIGKSTSIIKKTIEMCGNTALWPKMWDTTPRQFWYLYPDMKVATNEFRLKWVTEFMPRGAFKDHPTFGWKAFYDGQKKIDRVEWNSGITLFFKGYSMAKGQSTLQTATCHLIAADEEIPEGTYDELSIRLASVNGIFMIAFTATLGQELWYRAIERVGMPDEKLKTARKFQISMYDCQRFVDGTPSRWTDKYISDIKDKCKSEKEVQRRVYGKFVRDEGLTFHMYEPGKHKISKSEYRQRFDVKDGEATPKNWLIYTGVDIGGGGTKGHPTAITFIAVRPDFQLGVVFRGWRGDGIPTSSPDIYDKYIQLRSDMKPVMETYDGAALDYYNYATAKGIPLVAANKARDAGKERINDLFKLDMLYLVVDEDDPYDEVDKLSLELTTLSDDTAKRVARDDFADSNRYTNMCIPWDLEAVSLKHGPNKYVPYVKKEKTENEIRREMVFGKKATMGELESEEIKFWNDLY